MGRNRQKYAHVDHDDEQEYVEDQGDVQKREISIDNAVEAVGFGSFQVRVLVAAGICFAADAMQVILLTFLTEVLQKEWDLSEGFTESITSCLFAGSMLGTLVLGPLADSIGRRPVFLLSGVIISIFGFGTALAANYWILTAMVFMVGVGVGGLTVPFDVLAEFLPSERRGTYLLLIEYFWTVGCLFVVLAARMTLHAEVAQWRLFVFVCSIPCLLSVFLAYLHVPESARWLCAEDRTDEALRIMRQVAQTNGLDPFVVFPEGTKLLEESEKQEASMKDLLTPKWRWTILRLWGAWLTFAFGYYGVIEAITRVFEGDQASSDSNTASHPSSTSSLDESRQHDFDYTAIFVSSAAELVGTTLVIVAVDRAGRISSQVVSYTSAGVCVCLLCVLASVGSSRNLLVSLGFTARVFEMAGTCVTWVSTAEILTTEVRSTGHSTANALARLGAFCTPFIVQGSIPLTYVGLIMLLTHLFTALCVSKLPETKGRGMGSSSGPLDILTPDIDRDGVFTIDSHDEEDDASTDGSGEANAFT